LFTAEASRGPRLKGKERKDQVKEYRFSSEKQKALAEIIARAKGVVPRRIMVTLADVKRLRKESTEWHVVQGIGTLEGHNSHKAYVQVLEGIYATLKPCCADLRLPSPTVSQQATSALNLYQDLEVYEPFYLPTTPISSTYKGKKVIYKAVATPSSIRMIVYFYLRNSHALKLHNLKQWRRYKEGSISLQGASETMNVNLYALWALEDNFHTALQEKQKNNLNPRRFPRYRDLLDFGKAKRRGDCPCPLIFASAPARSSSIVSHSLWSSSPIPQN
jgi:hypothetical protein